MTIRALGSNASHIQTTFSESLAAAQNAFMALEQHKGASTVATTLETLNALLMMLDRGSNDAGLYRNVHPDAEVRAIADKFEQEFSKLATELSLSRPIYDALVAIDASKEDDVTKRYVKNALRDFRRAGVDKDPQARERVRKLKEELVVTGQQFSKNINEDVRSINVKPAELEGLPQDYIDAHKPGADGAVTITTDYPDYVPFMTYAKNDKCRRELYVINRQRGFPSNQKVLGELLTKRRELAGLLGYDSWARYITEDKMIKTPEAAQEFIDKVNKLAEPRAQEEYGTLLKRLQQDDPSLKAVGDWQKTYVEEAVRREHYSFDSQSVRAYFPYNRVKQGVLDTIGAMFDVTFEADKEAPVWHPSVEAYILRSSIKSGGELLGRFYLDMHPRENKYKHAAAFPIRSGVQGKQIPEAALICNFPAGDSLMEHGDVETFFHEFGHLIHHLFGGNQRWVAVSGITTEWDFVEAPSQLLEEWAWNSDALKKFAISTKGETIPDALVEKMRATRDYGKGLATKHQMFYAALSLAFYARDAKGLDTTKVVEELQKKYSPFAYVPDTHFQFSFGHLDGYSAIYYTYMWSLAIAKDLFSVFEAQGMFNPEPAQRYRNIILESGGSRDADVIVHEFLKRDYSFDSFAEWLNR